MQPLLSLSYWISLNPPSFMPTVLYGLLAFFGLVFASGFGVWGYASRSAASKLRKRAWGRAASHLGWTGFTGLLLVMFAYEGVPLLTVRAAYLAWLVWFVVGAAFIARVMLKDIPAKEAEQRERLEREKWLPKRA